MEVGIRLGCGIEGLGTVSESPHEGRSTNCGCACMLNHKEGSWTGKREGTTDGQRGEDKTDGE